MLFISIIFIILFLGIILLFLYEDNDNKDEIDLPPSFIYLDSNNWSSNQTFLEWENDYFTYYYSIPIFNSIGRKDLLDTGDAYLYCSFFSKDQIVTTLGVMKSMLHDLNHVSQIPSITVYNHKWDKNYTKNKEDVMHWLSNMIDLRETCLKKWYTLAIQTER